MECCTKELTCICVYCTICINCLIAELAPTNCPPGTNRIRRPQTSVDRGQCTPPGYGFGRWTVSVHRGHGPWKQLCQKQFFQNYTSPLFYISKIDFLPILCYNIYIGDNYTYLSHTTPQRRIYVQWPQTALNLIFQSKLPMGVVIS